MGNFHGMLILNNLQQLFLSAVNYMLSLHDYSSVTLRYSTFQAAREYKILSSFVSRRLK